MQIPDVTLIQDIEEYRQFQGRPDYKPLSMIPTTFGTAKRFNMNQLNYTQHATHLSALDFSQDLLKNVGGP